MTRRPLPAAAVLALLGCAGGGDGAPSAAPPPRGELVVGLQSDELGPLITKVHAVVRQDGAVVHDETLPDALPKELRLSGAPGARVEVALQALGPGDAVIVSRLAAARLLPADGGQKLLRVVLESRCADLGLPRAPCAAPLTCAAGSCVSPEVADAALEDYDPAWATAPPDICRPAKRGAPEVRIGTGQTDYATLEDEQVLELEKGPQGGHHVWIAARMRNLRQSGSTTSIRSALVDDPGPVPPVAFVFGFEPDEGSFCKVWGLRYQVDAGADFLTGYQRFLGKRLTITVEVKDSTGASASATKTVRIAEQLLCPDGGRRVKC